MEAYKKEFIEFMVESQVLKFGEFTLKSGRKSPFFMNAGAYVTGGQLKRLANTMLAPFMTTSAWISMWYSALPTRAFRWSLLLPLLWKSCTARKLSTAATAKK